MGKKSRFVILWDLHFLFGTSLIFQKFKSKIKEHKTQQKHTPEF